MPGESSIPPARLHVYNLLAVAASVLVGPLAAVACLFKPSWRRGLWNRLGFGWPGRSDVPTLWAHAASVGEIEGIGPLVARWRDEHPEGRVIVSALTATGCDVARAILPFAEVRAFPFDLPMIGPRVVRRLNPDLFLFSENELWPNVLTTLARIGVPTIQVSGRLSRRAADALGRFPALSAGVLGRVSRFCVQGEADRARLVDLGVDSSRVVVTGSLKGDGRMAPSPGFLVDVQRTDRPLVVAGSTHEGEEHVVLAAMRLLGAHPARPYWILAPRHPERFDAIASLLREKGVRHVRRTKLPDAAPERRRLIESADVLLLDTVGELAGCFPVAASCFIGGSLVPIGGHNLLEPARCGTPIVVGPHLDSVRDLAERLEEVGAATVVSDADGLARAVAETIDAGPDATAGDAARGVAEERAGSLSRTWICLAEAAASAEPR